MTHETSVVILDGQQVVGGAVRVRLVWAEPPQPGAGNERRTAACSTQTQEGDDTMTEYNAWPNRETWLAALWIGNDEPTYRAVRLLAMATAASDESVGKLADQIEAFVSDLAERTCPGVVEGASFVSDLFGYAFAAVDWREIATGELTAALAEAS